MISTHGVKLNFTRNDWLGRLDSNQRSRDQNPMPYRLATPQYDISRQT